MGEPPALSHAPGLGHNHPPEPLDPIAALDMRLAKAHRELVVRFIDLELGCARVPNPLQTDGDAAAATDFIAQCQSHIKKAEAAHRQEKEYFLKAGRIVDAFFKRRSTRLTSAMARAVARLKAYRDRIAELEAMRHEEARRAGEAEARRAAEEEAEYRAEADRLAMAAKSPAERQGAAEQLLLADAAATGLTRANYTDPEARRATAALIPLGRLGQPADLVGAVLFLASDESRWATGSTVTVDGGYLAI